MDAKLKENLPQEGTGHAGESLSEHSSGCPTYSGGGTVLPHEESITQDRPRILTQQIFHPGLFNRPRSSSLTEVSRKTTKDVDMQPYEQNISVKKPAVPDWQRIPKQNQKRIRSPEEKVTATNAAKRINVKKPQKKPTIIKQKAKIELDQNPAIKTQNRFALLNTENAEKTPQKNVLKETKPPPIMLYGIEDVGKLSQFLEEVANKNDFSYRIASKNQLIISTNSVITYKALIEHIRSRGLIGHTFTCKDQKTMRIVIKHLHFSTPKDAIIAAIELSGNTVKGEIVTARKPGTKEPLNTFFVNIVQHENNKLVKEIKYIYNQKVIIEDPKRQNTIVQCKRCQQYGHTKNNCMRPYRCVKCAGPHITISCTMDKNTPATCTLCSGNHPANYKGCRVYKEIYARKQVGQNTNLQPRSSKQTLKTALEKERNTEHITTTYLEATPTIANNVEHRKTYCEATKTQKRSTADNLKEKVKVFKTYNNNSEEISQRTNLKQIEPQEKSNDHINRLESLIIKQAERIDQLLSQFSTMMNLITSLIDRLPK